MTTQLFIASTAFGVATLVAASKDGAFREDAWGEDDRRVLVLSNNAAVPETAFQIQEVAGSDTLWRHFDAVYSYNDAIAPHHPSAWAPRPDDAPLWERYFRRSWGLDACDVRLVVESIQAHPALALSKIFADAQIDVYADGLMSYGPTRIQLPSQVASRVQRLLHLDLVPGLRPMLLTEWGVSPQIITTDAFRRVIAELVDDERRADVSTDRVALLLGQYLSAAGILTEAEEHDLHLAMIRGAVKLGHRRLIFKPHPTAPNILVRPLVAEAEKVGAELVVRSDPELAESLFERLPVDLVVGCFSTALMTARACYGLPVARVGTELLLERLRPFENSNRIPVTLIDALVPDLRSPGGGDLERAGTADLLPGLTSLVTALSYAMQPIVHAQLRGQAETFLRSHPFEARRYFKLRRLTGLQLPGGAIVTPFRRWVKGARGVLGSGRRVILAAPRIIKEISRTADQQTVPRRSGRWEEASKPRIHSGI